MALDALDKLLEDGRGGVFALPTPVAPKDVQASAKRAGFAYFHVDGKNIGKKEQLLINVATTLRFPAHFGHNWDALEECLVDMEGIDADGFVIHYDHTEHLMNAHPDQFETFVEICRDAVASWKEDGTPMVFLLSGAKAPKGVAKLSAKPADDE